MPTSNILRLDDYRDKRDQRVRLAASLYGADIGRSALLRHLADLAALMGADRAATVRAARSNRSWPALPYQAL